VCICDNKVIAIDLRDRSVRELPRQGLDNKAPTCCALLCLAPRAAAVAAAPLLAVGCNDGVVRLVQLPSLRVRRRAHHRP